MEIGNDSKFSSKEKGIQLHDDIIRALDETTAHSVSMPTNSKFDVDNISYNLIFRQQSVHTRTSGLKDQARYEPL
jgi:hypothetical protein